VRLPIFKTFRNPLKFGAACLSELASPALRWKLRNIPPPGAKATWRKGLLIGAHHIGDVLYGSSSLARLPALFPDCAWDIIAPGAAGDILLGNPGIRRVWDFPIPSRHGAAGFSELAAERYDVTLSYSSGMYVRPIRLAVDLGIPNRIGYSHKGFSAWFTQHVPITYPSPYPAYFCQAVACAAGVPPDWSLRPVVFPQEEHAAIAHEFRQSYQLTGQQPLMICCPTSRQPQSRISSRKLLEILRLFEKENPGVQTLLMGAADEVPQLREWKSEFQLQAHLPAHPLPVLALAELFRSADLVLCLDSGPRHLANSVHAAVFFLRNLASNDTETGSYVETEVDLVKNQASCCSVNQTVKILNAIDIDRCVSRISSTIFPK